MAPGRSLDVYTMDSGSGMAPKWVKYGVRSGGGDPEVPNKTFARARDRETY